MAVYYPAFKSAVGSGEINLDTAVLRVALMAVGFSQNLGTQANWADVSAQEIAGGNGYTANGEILVVSAPAVVSNNAVWAVADVVWSVTGGNLPGASGIVIYVDSHASDLLAYAHAFSATRTGIAGNTFTLTALDMTLG